MRAALVVAAVGLLAGCSNNVSLTLLPSGAQTVSGPTVIKAGQQAQWTLSGPGALSDTFGDQVTYYPPAAVSTTNPPTATVTATSNGASASVVLTVMPPPRPPGVIPGLGANVSVTYDAEGIPHVFCAAAADCYAATGYLHAQDRLFQMDLFRRTARGRLASMLGAAAVPQDTQLLTLFVTRDGQRIEDALVSALDAPQKALLDAYAGGVNAYLTYLAAHPTQMPWEYSTLGGAAWTPADIPQWTDQDTLAIARLQQFELSETIEKETAYGTIASVFGPGGSKEDLGRFAAWVRAQQPLNGFTLADTDASPVAPRQSAANEAAAPAVPVMAPWGRALAQLSSRMDALQPLFGTMRTGAGSNNWVVDAAHSSSGKAMLANDPHLALQYPPLFHLISLTASDNSGLNIQGAMFPGIPIVVIGRGAHVAFGATVVGYDVTDLYLEQIVPAGNSGCPAPALAGCAVFNSGVVPLVAKVFSIQVRGGAAQNVTVAIVPHHGPLVSLDQTTGKGVSARWTGQDITNDTRGYLALNVATAVGDTSEAAGTAFGALKDYAVGAQNFVLADDQGHIGYDPHALVPRRKWLEDQVAAVEGGANPQTTFVVGFPWFPMDGQSGNFEWGSGTAGDNCAGTGSNLPAAACWVPDSVLPRGVDPAKGYFVTANSDPAGYTASPFAVAAQLPYTSTAPPGLYPYLSFDWDDPADVRYSRIAELLKAKTSSGKMAVSDMQAVQTDHSMLLAKLFAPSFPAGSGGSYGAAMAMMATWATDGYDCPTGLTGINPQSPADPDATRNRDSASCLLFHVFLRTVLSNVFDDDIAVVAAASGRSFGADFSAEIRGLLYMLTLPDNSGGATFCNDVSSTNAVLHTHSCKEQLQIAMASAYDATTAQFGAPSNWLWGRVHTLTTVSPGAPLLQAGAGPYARPGGALTVDVGNPEGSSTFDFSYAHGSNIRFIAEMDDAATAVTKMQLPGPESDGQGAFGLGGPDLIEHYVVNDYFDFTLGHEADGQTASTMGFTSH